MFKYEKKFYKWKVESEKLKVKFSSHCEDERSEDAAIQAKSAGSPRAKASRFTKKSFLSSFQPFNKNNRITLKSLSAWACHLITQGENTSIMSFTHPTPKALAMTKKVTPFNLSTLQLFNLQKAFTLAEVLITLVVIGVVAAITVPILFNSTNDKEYNVARQKAKATIGEAFKLMTINNEIDKDKSTKEFVEEVLPKYLKVSKLCGLSDTATNLTDCGFSSTVKRPDGTPVNLTTIGQTWQSLGNPKVWTENPPSPSTWATLVDYNSPNPNHNTGYALQTVDGFSLDLFYNPLCASTTEEKVPWYNSDANIQMSMDVVCFNAIYDMNGPKGPNQVGKDIGFVGSFYNNYSTNAEAVLPHDKPVQASEAPGTSGTDYVLRASQYCKNLSEDGTWVVPNIDELSLLHINLKLIYDETPSVWFGSRSPQLGTPYFRHVGFGSTYGGHRSWHVRSNSERWVRCVRNTALK